MFDDDETEITKGEINSKFDSLIKMFLNFIFLWQSSFRVSDVGIDLLLKFLSLFMVTLAIICPINSLRELASQLPKSVSAGRKIIGTNADIFTKFVCCRACTSIYPIDECKSKLPDGQWVSKRCNYVRFPNHPQLWRRKACNTLLLKLAKTSAQTTILRPFRIYCYKSLQSSIRESLHRPDFFELCERWRYRNIEPVIFMMGLCGKSLWKLMESHSCPCLTTLP